MSLHTFEVRWRNTDGQVKYTRLLTSDVKSCQEYFEKNHIDTFVSMVSCEQEHDKTTYCDCCGQETSSNHIG